QPRPPSFPLLFAERVGNHKSSLTSCLANPLTRRLADSHQLLRRLPSQPDAIGNADAVVGVAGQLQSGQPGHALRDALLPLLVANRVLGHGPPPARNLRVLWFGILGKDLFAEYICELTANRGYQGRVGFGE